MACKNKIKDSAIRVYQLEITRIRKQFDDALKEMSKPIFFIETVEEREARLRVEKASAENANLIDAFLKENDDE